MILDGASTIASMGTAVTGSVKVGTCGFCLRHREHFAAFWDRIFGADDDP